jgi:hypothetical protein
MVYIFCCIIVKTPNLKDLLWLTQKKTCLFSVKIGMPLANALKLIEYTDTVMFLTIGNSYITQLKSYVVSDFHPSIRKPQRVTNKY